ncbi:putative secreted protein [Streptomyces azureus]|uniref:Putative secreted protein n=1 Tax=Streptomyces azureus TaxID=146537 RepID=A0A0K8PXT8_STRAJ|nr:putative secreted protein [Streptomyces azureus]
MPAGSVGSTVRANRVFRVLAGGSLRCALWAASTSPVRASATSQDSAEVSGRRGAPARGRTCVPGRYSSEGCGTAALGPTGGLDSAWPELAAAAGIRARSPAAQSAQADTASREENPMSIRST